MIGDNIGPLIWQGIKNRAREWGADYWLIALALVLFFAGLWVGGWQ